MDVAVSLVLCAIVSLTWGLNLTFPPGFQFGVATSAYQVEGAWNVSDKTQSIWDRYTHNYGEYISDHSTGDIACDSYHNWKRDVEMVAELGVHFYRFSISWTRLLPKGFPTHISEDGKNYYNNLIDALLEKGIQPFVTIYHWDLPQRFQDLGGWSNPLMSDWFVDYARVVFSLYGDRVKTWITFNEPASMCELAFNTGVLAPRILDKDVAPYLCDKHVLIAHAKTYRVFDAEFRAKYGGQISLASQLLWFDPLTEEDEELAEQARLNIARTSHPVFSKEGGWPPVVEKIIAEKSNKSGLPNPSVLALSEDEIKMIKGTYDFYALNHYTSRLIRKALPNEKLKPWPLYDCEELDAVVEFSSWKQSASFWFYVNPRGLRETLGWLKKEYGDLNIFITENGLSTHTGLNDMDRIQYYKDYLEQVLLAIQEDGVNVTGYTAWSLMDNFEWLDGYKFGLYEVDFTSPLRTRTPRASARYYSSIVAKHSLDVPVPDIKLEEFINEKAGNVDHAIKIESDKTNIDRDYTNYFIFGVIVLIVVVIVVVVVLRRKKTKTNKLQRPNINFAAL